MASINHNITVTERQTANAVRPSVDGARAFVLSVPPDHIQTVTLDPGFFYEFTFTPSTTNDQPDQLTTTRRRTEEPSQPPGPSRVISCWPTHREETGYSHLTLNLMSQKVASDGAGKFFEFAYGVELSKNLNDDDVSHATAIVHVQGDGTIYGVEPDHLLDWLMPIDGEGTTATLLPRTIRTERHRPSH